MFTGLIEEIGTVRAVARGGVAKLRIAAGKLAREVQVGDSVSIDGACLTVTSVDNHDISFDAVPETLSRSTLGELKPGDRVNLESSLRAGNPIGGHFVLGHVDAVGSVESVRSLGESSEIAFRAPREVMRCVVQKGSIALDGISLTVASCEADRFTVAVIPHTLSVTTLGSKKPGDRVNLEADIIGKYVEKLLGRGREAPGVTEETLRDAGFM